MNFYIFFFELRKRTGGYHLDSFYKCYFATVAIYLAVMLTVTSLVKYQLWRLGAVVDAKYLETVRALSEGCCEECIDSNLIDFFLSNDLVISN